MNQSKGNEEQVIELKVEEVKVDEADDVVEEFEDKNDDIKKIMEQVILDPDFKEKLITDPDSVLVNYKISEISKIMIKSLTRDDYDKLSADNITEYFSADSAIYTPDFDDSVAIEYVDEDDI